MKIESKINDRSVKIGIIGLGYVGLPLAVEFAKAGVDVVGIDNDESKINSLNSLKSYIGDVKDHEIESVVSSGRFSFSSDYSIISSLDAVSICVPTPLRKTKEPDISYIQSAVEKISKYMHKDILILLESTTYPGTTEEIILPELEKSGLKVGEDFFLAFSPERVDPSNKNYNIKNTPKVIGGITKKCTHLAKLLYEIAIDQIVPVSNSRSAELVKLLENSFRSINIGLVNELSQICDRLDLDAWEIIDAAKTKPFGFMPFYPGPGIGGHCIPIDPLYLTWKLRAFNAPTRFISLADEINSNMPRFVANKSSMILNKNKKAVNGSRILVLGTAYKKNVNDCRESPAVDLIALLDSKGAIVSYSDKFIDHLEVSGKEYSSVDLTKETLSQNDLIVIVTDHDYFKWDFIVENANAILDTRNVLKDYKNSGKIVKL